MISLAQTSFRRMIAIHTHHHLHRSTKSTTISSSRLRHTVAISREIPDSFIDALSFHHDQSTSLNNNDESNYSQDVVVSLEKSREQHANYLHVLREHVPQLICLPSIGSHPDCLFVEDTMIAINDTVVLTRMGHESRRGEVDDLLKGVVREQLGLKNVYDMSDVLDADIISDDDNDVVESSSNCCDGGDVLYTGRHLFVGITDRTNQGGFQYLKNVFAHRHNMIDEIDVVPVPMMSLQGADTGGGVLHLKSAVTHIDDETLLLPESKFGDILSEEMKVTERGYTAIRLPDVLSCNAVVVNGHVMAQDSPCSVSKRRIEHACRERNLGLTFVDTSELAKKDAALTCCSVLLSG